MKGSGSGFYRPETHVSWSGTLVFCFWPTNVFMWMPAGNLERSAHQLPRLLMFPALTNCRVCSCSQRSPIAAFAHVHSAHQLPRLLMFFVSWFSAEGEEPGGGGNAGLRSHPCLQSSGGEWKSSGSANIPHGSGSADHQVRNTDPDPTWTLLRP